MSDHICQTSCLPSVERAGRALAKAAKNHGVELESFCAVVIGKDEDGDTTTHLLGICNGAGLNEALETILQESIQNLEPTECQRCDAIRRIAPVLLDVWRHEMGKLGLGEKSTCN